MPINEEDNLRHVGVLGMHWGQRKAEESGGGGRSRSGSSKPSGSKPSKKDDIFDPKKSTAEKNAAILKKNPNAAVVNYEALKKSKPPVDNSARNRKIRNIAIGVGLGLTVTAGAVLYVKNKKSVDGAISSFLQKKSKIPLKDLSLKGLPPPIVHLKDLPPSAPLSSRQKEIFNELGLKNINTKQDVIATNWITSWIRHDDHRYDAISEITYNSLDDTDISLKPGQVIKRITKTANEVLRDNAYVSFDDDDNNRYAAILPAIWKVNGGLRERPKTFSMTMETLEEIKSPSAKKRIDIFTHLLKNDSSFGKSFYDFQSDLLGVEGYAEEFSREKYNTLATGLANKDSLQTKTYLSEIRRRGYNALVDDNDAGRLTRSPLILLNSKSVSHKETVELTKSMVAQAVNSIKQMDGEDLPKTLETLVNDRSSPMFVQMYKDALNP